MNQKKRLRIICIQSLLATVGSLYYGFYGDPIVNLQTGEWFYTLNGFSPCELCRYARIIVYPITFLSFIALIKKDTNIAHYTQRLAIAGIILEVYHYVLQKAPIENSHFCTLSNPCNALGVNYFGFITIPFLCLIACIVILIASRQILKKRK